MIESGLLVEDPRGGVTMTPGSIQTRGLEPLLVSMLTDFTRAAEALLRSGVIGVQNP